MTNEYHLPGIRVAERRIDVPLDWSAGSATAGTIELLVRELVDPERARDDLPLLAFLQGGPGGANPRPLRRDGWIDEALRDYRVVLVDQRGTGGSTPLEAVDVGGLDAAAGADLLALHRADSIVRDLEHVRETLYGGRRWATLGQSYGGFLTLTYLSLAPDALTACYVCGGIPGTPPRAAEVYARTFDRVAAKTAELYRRFPGDAEAIARIADRLADGDVTLPDGDVLTVRRFQSLGIDLGMKPGHERLHWLVEKAFARPGRLSEAFLADVQALSSSAGNPLFCRSRSTATRRADRPRGRRRPNATVAPSSTRAAVRCCSPARWPFRGCSTRCVCSAGSGAPCRRSRSAPTGPRCTTSTGSRRTTCRWPRRCTSTTCTSTRGCSSTPSRASATRSRG